LNPARAPTNNNKQQQLTATTKKGLKVEKKLSERIMKLSIIRQKLLPHLPSPVDSFGALACHNALG